jgi:hypothetical protein
MVPRPKVGRAAFVAVLLVAASAFAFALARTAQGCPSEWAGAEHVAIAAHEATFIRVDPLHLYEVGGSALLEYSPSAGNRHPLSVIVAVGGSRANLQQVEFTCLRATHGDEVWSVRPTDGGINSPSGDGAPSGRSAFALGPEWPPGDTITMEAWLRIDDRRYVLVFPPLTLTKGA